MDLHIVVKTDWLRFADDVFFHAECDGDDVVIWVHSESRVGISDLGVNQERIEEIKDRLVENTVTGTACS